MAKTDLEGLQAAAAAAGQRSIAVRRADAAFACACLDFGRVDDLQELGQLQLTMRLACSESALNEERIDLMRTCA